MANLVVSNLCNLSCPYCFAGGLLEGVSHAMPAGSPLPDRRETASRQRFITMENLEARLDFLDSSGINEIRLIGGEPTLHPLFPEVVQRTARRGKHLVIFTHGLLSERALSCLENLPAENCTVLVNMNATSRSGQAGEREQQVRRRVLKRLGVRAILGFNIYRPEFQCDTLLPLVEEAGCRKAIRLGLAQPVFQGRNFVLHPKQYPAAGAKIARFGRLAAQYGIQLEFDCGFVRCMFSETDLESLRRAHADLGWRCGPVLDITLDDLALHCFPLGGKFSIRFDASQEATALRSALEACTRPFRQAGIYKECSACRYKLLNECSGGCLSATLRRFYQADFRLAVPARQLDSEL